MIKSLFSLLRPFQWAKNVFIFLPLFFDRQFENVEKLLSCMIVFFAYCFVASSIYCFNDIHDIDDDRVHPMKCKRPIASGAISITKGYIIMFVSFIIGLSFTFMLDKVFMYKAIGILVLYFITNIAYCVKLKQFAIVDVLIIAFGFVLRVVIGGFVTGIFVSQWIVLMTFLIALFLAFAKRHDDVVLHNETGITLRNNTNRYNLNFLNQTLAIIGSITMVCYIMYTVSDDVCDHMNTHYLYFTSVFVLAGIIRYLQLTLVDDKSGSPTRILMKDRFIQLCILSWIISFIIIIYV